MTYLHCFQLYNLGKTYIIGTMLLNYVIHKGYRIRPFHCARFNGSNPIVTTQVMTSLFKYQGNLIIIGQTIV